MSFKSEVKPHFDQSHVLLFDWLLEHVSTTSSLGRPTTTWRISTYLHFLSVEKIPIVGKFSPQDLAMCHRAQSKWWHGWCVKGRRIRMCHMELVNRSLTMESQGKGKCEGHQNNFLNNFMKICSCADPFWFRKGLF